jgi:hypothetical protein
MDFSRPLSPNFSAKVSIYQDVPGLQLAKCTYGGMEGWPRSKSRSTKVLKFSTDFFRRDFRVAYLEVWDD